MKNIFFTTINQALNAVLRLDPDTPARLSSLSGKVIALDLLPFHLTFQLTFSDREVSVHEGDQLTADTTITGTPLQLFAMVTNPADRNRFFAEDLQVTGDVELGQQVIRLFDALHIDWEEQLSSWVGDIPTYYASRFIHQVNDWAQQTQNVFRQNMNEYLHEELAWFPTPEELQDFFHDIDELRMDTDRIATKIAHLRTKIAGDLL